MTISLLEPSGGLQAAVLSSTIPYRSGPSNMDIQKFTSLLIITQRFPAHTKSYPLFFPCQTPDPQASLLPNSLSGTFLALHDFLLRVALD